jgi:uncharacterized membrane protein
MSKALRLVLLASLVLNVVLVGAFLGRLTGEESRSLRQRTEAELKKLAEPAQSRIREQFQKIRAAGDPPRKKLDEARAEALRIFAAEPFDEVAYDRQIQKIDDLRAEMFNRIDQAVKQTASELSPAERRLFADLLRRPPRPSS